MDAVVLENGEKIPCDALLLATEAPATARLLERPAPRGTPHGTTVAYFASEQSLYDRPLLALPAGRGRLVRHFVQLTNVAPEYAPPGTHLVAATVLDRRGLDDIALAAAASREIAEFYPVAADALRPLAVMDVPYGQHPQPAGFRARIVASPARTAHANVWLAGDQTGPCSVQSAMESGERAAWMLARS